MIKITGQDLTLHSFMRVVRFFEKIELSEEATSKVEEANRRIKAIIGSGKTVYGVNTGFGKMSDVAISKADLRLLQENLLKSHACGVGEHFNEEVVRGIMLLRINALAKGYSGIRLKTLNQLMIYLNERIVPAIPEQGSLGASGDLAQLSHMGLTLLGLGEVYYENRLMPTSEALVKANLQPLSGLEAKEGLSLINGTQAMTSVGAITVYDAINLAKTADIAGALSFEALNGIRDAFFEEVHSVRGQIGQMTVAKNIRRLTEGSGYSTAQGEIRVQDAYSLRCLAQVHGASRDALDYVKAKVEIEMNAATDNPLVFSEDSVISGGNFHGQPLALAFDFLKIAISEFASISERRIERLVNPNLNGGLPAFLAKDPGLNSGFMIVQYSAASLVSENKVLAHPASVDSISSSANQEDHVSMGTIAARGARDILRNAQQVLGMELFTACQALDLREKKTMGLGTAPAYQCLRQDIPFIEKDQIMYYHLNVAKKLVTSNVIVEAASKAIGSLD